MNDNKAMQDACGSGFTPIGFDDAGCGKKKCVSSINNILTIDYADHLALALWQTDMLSCQSSAEELHVAWRQ